MACNPSNVPDKTQEELRILIQINQEERRQLLAEMESLIPILTSPTQTGKIIVPTSYDETAKNLELNGDLIWDLQNRLKN